MGFTAEELAEMAAADAEIEASFRLMPEDLERSAALDISALEIGRNLLMLNISRNQRLIVSRQINMCL